MLLLNYRLGSLAVTAVVLLSASAVVAQAPVIVQPGAPGQPTRVLPATTRAKLLSASQKDVEFMQGMIHHHAQAVEMTDMIESHTEDRDIRLIGERISKSQSDEIEFMKRWLERRGEPAGMHATAHGHEPPKGGTPNTEPPKGGTPNTEPPKGGTLNVEPSKDGTPNAEPPKGGAPNEQHMMPGMLTKGQMDALRKAKGAEFDRLFVTGMIQHHNGALVMVKDLFDSPGAGQDAELFTFATDVDSGQRAEINSLQTLLDKKP